MASTTSLSVTPLPLEMCLISASGIDRLENTRWLVMLTLIGVRGPNQVVGAFSGDATEVLSPSVSTLAGRSIW